MGVLSVLIQAVFGLIRGVIEDDIQGIKTGVQSKHVRVHTLYLRILFQADSVPKYSSKPSNII